jgi:hypothetical protein
MMVGMRLQEARNDLVAVRKKQRKPHVQEYEEWNGIWIIIVGSHWHIRVVPRKYHLSISHLHEDASENSSDVGRFALVLGITEPMM